MTKVHEAAQPLVEMQPKFDFFVGIDSDGCAFDTMGTKHKECFTSVADANIGNIFGRGFAPFKGGTLQYINDYLVLR